jgi:hypothetical protein
MSVRLQRLLLGIAIAVIANGQREGAFAPLVFVPRSAVTITGDVKYYDVKGDSGNIVSRGFCPACGARLFLKPAIMPDVIGIMAGALEDPTWYQSTMDIGARACGAHRHRMGLRHAAARAFALSRPCFASFLASSGAGVAGKTILSSCRLKGKGPD